MTNYRTTVAKSGVLFARIVQAIATLLAVVFIGGGIMGNMNIFAFAFLGIVSVVLLLVVLVVEFVLVRPIQRRVSGGALDGN